MGEMKDKEERGGGGEDSKEGRTEFVSKQDVDDEGENE